MQKPIIFLMIAVLILLAGCTTFYYKIDKFEPEKPNMGFNEQIKLYFDVTNSAGTTLVAKSEFEVNNTCFNKISDKEIGEIAPGKTIRSFVFLNSKDRSNIDSLCNGGAFSIKMTLLDVNGKELNTATTEVGIVE